VLEFVVVDVGVVPTHYGDVDYSVKQIIIIMDESVDDDYISEKLSDFFLGGDFVLGG
jgi:hypothetical protein